MIIISVGNSYAANIFVETVIEYYLIKRKFKITAFIWNIIIL